MPNSHRLGKSIDPALGQKLTYIIE